MNHIRNKIKQLGATILFVLLFLCVSPYVRGAAAEANGSKAVQESDVVVNYGREIITVRANGNEELYYGFAGAGKQLKEYRKIGTELIAEYKNGQDTYDAFYIDISPQTFKGETTFYVKYAENETALTVTLGERKSLKAVYYGKLPENEIGDTYADAYAFKVNDELLYKNFTEDTGYFTFLVDGGAFYTLADVEWRAGTLTNYNELYEMNPEIYQKSGASLYFRINSGDAPISKEAKIKVRKPAKAPTVKVDGTKHTLAMKDTQEYRIVYQDGTATEWTAVPEDTKSLRLSELKGMYGDGVSDVFLEVTVEVRNAASEKAAPSYAASFHLDSPALPKSGEDGVSVSQVNPMDLSKGLRVTNASDTAYMIAIADANAWDCNGNVFELIKKINYDAAKGAEGYLAWKTVKAGGSVSISYSSFKTFEDSYVVLFRTAPVKEDKKTPENEFRIASVVKRVGGMLPVPDVKPQAFLVESDADLQKKINFTKVDGHTLYVSVDGGAFAKNADWTLDITGQVGKSLVVKAYLVEDASEIESDTVSFRYSFVANGELDAYVNDWGYVQCKQLGWAVAYQRAYLATVSYDESFSIEGLSMDLRDVIRVITMMRWDNPEIIQLGNSYSQRGNDIYLPLGDQNVMDPLLTECQETAAAALLAIEKKYGRELTKIEYVKEIHDFIVLEKQYKSSSMDQTMAGILADAYTPVCTSYAVTFHYMCELAGIQTVVIHGDAKNSSSSKTESHVWNMVNLGETVDYSRMKTESGKEINPADWYEIDVTWDDPLGGDEDYVRYTYFNLTTEGMTADERGTKHIRSTGVGYESYPVENCTGTTYNYEWLVENNYVTE